MPLPPSNDFDFEAMYEDDMDVDTEGGIPNPRQDEQHGVGDADRAANARRDNDGDGEGDEGRKVEDQPSNAEQMNVGGSSNAAEETAAYTGPMDPPNLLHAPPGFTAVVPRRAAMLFKGLVGVSESIAFEGSMVHDVFRKHLLIEGTEVERRMLQAQLFNHWSPDSAHRAPAFHVSILYSFRQHADTCLPA